MEATSEEGNESRVDDGAFWHTNMDLYYGYVPGEIVEVVHEPNKYWLATIKYCFKHLILLKWIGNYGEFWVDTSMPNSTTSTTANEFNINPKRLFPLGYHLQSQLKSQFVLEKPTKFLEKPSLYNPSKDPYATIKTIDDLLAHELEPTNDTFHINQSANDNNDSASLVLAKCKTKIDYKQEDEEELETALMNLNAIDNAEVDKSFESSDIVTGHQTQNVDISIDDIDRSNDTPNRSNCEKNGLGENTSNQTINKDGSKIDECPSETDESLVDVDSDEICLELCKEIQEIAINRGYYFGIDSESLNYSDRVYFTKPKQFFDTGGANQERVFVPGTLLEISWTKYDKDLSIQEFRWFAYVVKNIGGRLTLRWFLCDEPKFKQGRLELKSCRSQFVEEEDSDGDGNDDKGGDKTSIEEQDIGENDQKKQTRLTTKDITFSLHFCDTRINTISHSSSYLLPDKITEFLDKSLDENLSDNILKLHLDHIFDIRRMNLDKDRPMIDHILSTVRSRAPNYLDLIFAPKDSMGDRQVLVSSSRMTKLTRGRVKREIRPGTFEIKLEEEIGEDDVPFIYPLDSSYTVLPLDWAENNQDCLSIEPSGNPTPTLIEHGSESTQQLQHDNDNSEKIDNVLNEFTNATHINCSATQEEEQNSSSLNIIGNSTVTETSTSSIHEQQPSSTEVCLKQARSQLPRSGCSFKRLTDSEKSNIPELKEWQNFNEFDPNCWSDILRLKEFNAPKFHCCIETSLKSSVEERFKVMDHLEVVHPLSDTTICLGRIRKVVFPLIWIQISTDCYTLLPFNSTNIYPTRWCETYGHSLVSLLPPRKRCINQVSQPNNNGANKKKKRSNVTSSNNKSQLSSIDINLQDSQNLSQLATDEQMYEKEHFDLHNIKSRQDDLDYMLNEKSKYVKIYFNHKCFTGPSLSKSKICSLPQYVGPGPLGLVLEEVVTKVISVAYVPPRILNDLSSATFSKLLDDKNLTDVVLMEFKAKYQKRVYREKIPVCISPDDVALYCECICEYIKCCYNLFGPELFDGDDCPGHCRVLTKSNKFMKRATYYRDKARAGEFLGSTSSNNNNQDTNNTSGIARKQPTNATSRARYAGRCSSESTSSSMSRSEQITSRASSNADDHLTIHSKIIEKDLNFVENINDEEKADNVVIEKLASKDQQQPQIHMETEYDDFSATGRDTIIESNIIGSGDDEDSGLAPAEVYEREFGKIFRAKFIENLSLTMKIGKTQTSSGFRWSVDSDFNQMEDVHPGDWSIDDVAKNLESCSLGRFKLLMKSEAIDGQALLLLDRTAIKEHFQDLEPKANFSPEEVGKLCCFVDYVKAWANGQLPQELKNLA